MSDRDERQYGRYDNLHSPYEQKVALSQALVEYAEDFAGFVMFLFPWGVPGTSLEHETGPDAWQREEQEDLSAHLRNTPDEPFRSATASGHGIGKSSQVSWAILWSTMTMVDARGVVTANSDTQLRTKTWAELAKWWDLACGNFPLLRELFTLTATAFYMNTREKTWRCDAIPNNPRNPAAFAGMHNAGKRVTIIVDEASEIQDPIWDTIDGALTDKDTQIILLTYGNPTKNVGRFKEAVIGRFRHLWRHRSIDSRTVKRTNKKLLDEWVEAWGLMSDFVKVRVLGKFPSVGSMQLISGEVVQAARERQPGYIPSDPLVVGLDIARFGDDASVLQPRKGRDARTLPRKEWRGIDTMTLASEVAAWCLEFRPDAIFVDVGGVGAGVYDRLIQLQVSRVTAVYPINFGAAGGGVGMNGVQARTKNKRASMWVDMREWLVMGAIANDADLETDLTGTEYGYTADGAILLEKKEHMKARGLSSPDRGDALALTFAYQIAPRKVAASADDLRGVSSSGQAVQTDYDPYAELEGR